MQMARSVMRAVLRQSMPAVASIAILVVPLIAGCAPEVGSEAWCAAMDEKPKGDWTANEAADYARNCLFD